MFNKAAVVNNNGLYDNSKNFLPKENADGEKKPFLRFSQIINLPPKKWLLKDFFGYEEVGIIYGPSGSGKSFVAIDLMFCAMLQQKFAGKFEFTERLKCLYICGEGYYGAIDRIKARAMLQSLPEDFDDYLGVQRDVIDLSKDVTTDLFIRAYKDMGFRLIIIDTLSLATKGVNENDNSAMADVVSRASKIARELKAVVILIHHSNKAGSGHRGASSIKNNCDFQIEFDQSGKKRTMACEKLKDADVWETMEFSLKGLPNFDGGMSAVVEWGGESTKPITQNGAIRMFLEKNCESWYTYEMIAEQLGNQSGDNPLSVDAVRVECGELFKDDIIIKLEDKELKKSLGFDTKKAVVKINPNVFFKSN